MAEQLEEKTAPTQELPPDSDPAPDNSTERKLYIIKGRGLRYIVDKNGFLKFLEEFDCVKEGENGDEEEDKELPPRKKMKRIDLSKLYTHPEELSTMTTSVEVEPCMFYLAYEEEFPYPTL